MKKKQNFCRIIVISLELEIELFEHILELLLHSGKESQKQGLMLLRECNNEDIWTPLMNGAQVVPTITHSRDEQNSKACVHNFSGLINFTVLEILEIHNFHQIRDNIFVKYLSKLPSLKIIRLVRCGVFQKSLENIFQTFE